MKNAKLYIEEIDNHKKSIFEFWKFTNKDKASELPEGKVEEVKKETIKKTFDYEFDFEDFASKLDEIQRNNLSKDELNSIYLSTTFVLDHINKIAKGELITDDDLKFLKEKSAEENSLSDKENFDIFSGISYDNKLKILANKKHRESEREAFRILDINKNTKIEDYTEYIKQVIENLKTAFDKIKIPLDLSIYKASTNLLEHNRFNVFNVEGKKAILDLLNEDTAEFNIYKINLKENANMLAFTNIAYFENNNKTLPLGMNVSEGILIDKDLIDLELKEKRELKIVTYRDMNDELSEIKIKTMKIEEYNMK